MSNVHYVWVALLKIVRYNVIRKEKGDYQHEQ